jgi:heptosyltransferase-1
VNQPNKILVIRLSAMGDIVMASPLIKCLRTRYPDAHICWLVQSEFAQLLTANTGLDDVITLPRGEWRSLWKARRWLQLAGEMYRFSRELRQHKFDMVIDLQGLLKSGIWARISGASERIGLGSREASGILMTRTIDRPKGDERIGSEYRHIAGELGCDSDDYAMQVVLSYADEQYATQLINKHNLNRGYCVICPFTTRPQKHWVSAYWPQLAERLRLERGIKTVILGGPENEATGDAMATGHPVAMINMSGKTSIRQAAAVISRASILVGVDTGLTHMGIAFGVPTIAIFGSTCPYLHTGNDNAVVIYKRLECSPCGRHPTCNGAYTCMASVTVDDVLTQVSTLYTGVPA